MKFSRFGLFLIVTVVALNLPASFHRLTNLVPNTVWNCVPPKKNSLTETQLTTECVYCYMELESPATLKAIAARGEIEAEAWKISPTSKS